MMVSLIAFGLLTQMNFPEAKVYDHPFNVVTRYDKITDKSSFDLELGDIIKKDDLEVELKIVSFFNGKERKANQTNRLRFYFISTSEEWEFLKVDGLNILADGERFSLKGGRNSGDVHKGGTVMEFLWYDLPVSYLLILADAKSVEGEIGIKKFRLSSSQIIAIKDYAARLDVSSEESDKIEAKRKAAQQERQDAIRKEFDSAIAAARREVTKIPKSLRLKKGNQIANKVLQDRLVPTARKYNLSKEEIGEFLKNYPEFNPR